MPLIPYMSCICIKREIVRKEDNQCEGGECGTASKG